MASPLLGYNNNVRHRGRLFHIQTEDSGARHPHVITHLFADGGRIVKSVKTSYAEHVGSPRLPDVVRNLMRDQHKAMFAALRAGELDDVIERTAGPLPPKPRPAPADSLFPVDHGTRRSDPGAGIEAALAAAARDARPSAPPAAPSGVPETGRTVRASSPPPRRSSRPPPPVRPAPARPGAPHARPAAADGPPPSAVGSIFGAEIASSKSLDEVILSYLAEEDADAER